MRKQPMFSVHCQSSILAHSISKLIHLERIVGNHRAIDQYQPMRLGTVEGNVVSAR